jgi:hypothetical protein
MANRAAVAAARLLLPPLRAAGGFTLLACIGCLGQASPAPVREQRVCASKAPLAAPDPLMIDDAENGDSRIILQQGRGGFLYTFVDEGGSDITPRSTLKGGQFRASHGGAHDSPCALNFRGQLVPGPEVFAGLGLDLTAPRAPYDASRYVGVAFLARHRPGTASRVRVLVVDTNTDPAGGACAECYNHFGLDLDLGPEWQSYELPFERFAQMPGWGWPRPPRVDSQRLLGLTFLVTDPGRSYDVWIDDIRFFGQAPPQEPALEPSRLQLSRATAGD